MVVRRMVCLANSYKNSGRCVAGIELTNDGLGQWIRPISNRPGRSINTIEQTCTDGSVCAALDVLDIDFGAPTPDGYQSENVLITPGLRWRKIGEVTAQDLEPALHHGEAPLWPFTNDSYNGRHDRIAAQHLPQIGSSLALVRPEQAAIRVFPKFNDADKLDVRVRFAWGGEVNDLKLTDPQMLEVCQREGKGNYEVANPLMCISIGEVFAPQNAAYKLVAGLIL